MSTEQAALTIRHPGLISVVIPAYNEGSRIGRCLRETHETMTALGSTSS